MLTAAELILAKQLGELHDNLIRPFSVLLRKYEKRERAVDDKGNYLFVPALGEEVAVNLMSIRKLFNEANPTLIDIGCGVGNINALARALGFNSYGFEINELYSEIGNPYNNITQGDIFQMDRLYCNVIFVYRPLHDMNKLFQHIKKIAFPNTILYSFGVLPTIEGTPQLENPFIIKL